MQMVFDPMTNHTREIKWPNNIHNRNFNLACKPLF